MLFPRLKALPVHAGRHSQVFGAVAAEIGQGREIHHLRNLGERQPLVVQILFQDGNGMAVDIRCHIKARYALP